MSVIESPTHAEPADLDAAPSGADCGCAENTRATLSRRRLLGGLAAAGVGTALAGSFTQLSYGASATGEVIVAVSLRGGFDGLSAVAPVGDPYYLKARPDIGVAAKSALKLDAMFGLHPALSPLLPLWKSKELAFVHAVGQTSPSRSHFQAMAEMEAAAPGSSLRTGWLDRMLGLGDATTFGGVSIGSTVPTSMMGTHPEMSMRDMDGFKLSGVGNDADLARWSTALAALHHNAPIALAGAARTTLSAVKTTRRLQAAGYTPAASAKYPETEFGRSLREVARLIKAKVGLRAATVDCGDWDMHAGMGQIDRGWMRDRLFEMASAIAAFWTDLGSSRSRVTVVTLSEFGRRVAQNGSGGTDHGHGNVCLVLGGGVVGGKVYGRWPTLNPSKLVQGDLAGTTDYRTILAEIIEKRQKVKVSTIFPKLASSRLGLIRSS